MKQRQRRYSASRARSVRRAYKVTPKVDFVFQEPASKSVIEFAKEWLHQLKTMPTKLDLVKKIMPHPNALRPLTKEERDLTMAKLKEYLAKPTIIPISTPS